jgi:flagellar basal body-associated protein FliL
MGNEGLTSEEVANDVSKILSAKKQRNILIIILLLLITGGVIFWNHFSNVKSKLAISEQNNKALSDSVRVERNKVDDLTYSKNILVSDKKDLKKLNSKLGEELEKQRGKVRQLNHIVASVDNDTVYVPTEVITYVNDDSTETYGLSWDYDTTYSENNTREIAGVSKFDLDSNGVITPLETTLSKDITKFTLTTGLREKDGNIEIFATSPHPNLTISELDGAIIDPKKHPVIKEFTRKKRFGIGPYIGAGLGVNLSPNVNIGLGFQVGIGIHYDIIRF